MPRSDSDNQQANVKFVLQTEYPSRISCTRILKAKCFECGRACFRYKTKHDVSHFSASDSTSDYNTSHYFLHVQKCIIKYQMSKRLLLKSYFFRQSQNFVNRWRCSGLLSQMCSPAGCISNSLQVVELSWNISQLITGCFVLTSPHRFKQSFLNGRHNNSTFHHYLAGSEIGFVSIMRDHFESKST